MISNEGMLSEISFDKFKEVIGSSVVEMIEKNTVTEKVFILLITKKRNKNRMQQLIRKELKRLN